MNNPLADKNNYPMKILLIETNEELVVSNFWDIPIDKNFKIVRMNEQM